MENLINKVIEALEMRLGEGYTIIPKDKRKNNGLILHGICICREGDSISPVIYPEEFDQDCSMGNPDPDEVADSILKIYSQSTPNIIPRNVSDYLKNFIMVKEKIRIKLINHAANIGELGNIPHRKFLDLAIIYYLDMEPLITGHSASAIITNELMEIWGITEDDLYMIGMEKLLSEDGGSITDMPSILREIMQEEPSTMTESAIDEIEKDRNAPEMYVASNRKRLFGANCLMNVFLLHGLAESTGCSLIIFPSSIHELVIIPQKNGSEDCMSTEDIQEINVTQVLKEEWLSNSIYRYDRAKREVSIYKEGAPL